jgi:16S rRNA (guanine527-N7)-methyltransferase
VTAEDKALKALADGSRAILERPLESHELEGFTRYLALLQKWQRVHRLVGSVEAAWIVENLFLDSLLFLRVMPPDVSSAVDIGSGAGVPGIPIKIVRPQLKLTLVEARERRVSFLSTVVRELGLHGVGVHGGRVESLPADSGTFGAAIIRCAGDPGRVIPEAARLVAPGGSIILSGPPMRRTLERGDWAEVPGVRPGSTRRFVVLRV